MLFQAPAASKRACGSQDNSKNMDEQNRELNINFSPLGKGFRPIAGTLAVVLLLSVIAFMIFAAMNELKQSRYIGQDIVAKNTITISGEGKIFATPDIGVISLGVISQASTVAAAQKDNTEKMNKITEAMKNLGVEEKDLKTTNYNIYPRYSYSRGTQTLIGYEVNQTLEVKIRNLDNVGEILAKGAELGANQVGSLSFTFDDSEKLEIDARKKAIANAKEKADALAEVLDVKLIRIVSFNESSYIPSTPYYAEKALGIGGGGDAVPDIQTGENEITSNVTIVYEIL
jgi:uncharacterized protein YggE